MSEPDHYLVVGSGSIARRHVANLKKLFPDALVGCVSNRGRELTRQEIGADIIHVSLPKAMENACKFAIIASPAPFHLSQAAELVGNNIPVLVEKPLTDSLINYQKVAHHFTHKKEQIAVAYNLRFLPSANTLSTLLKQQVVGKIHSVIINVGQFLPDWRPQSDYRKNVSANKALGGGVLLELSHELDYLLWLFGPISQVFCMATTSGTLDIDVEDQADAILIAETGLVINLHMDFLQRKATRVCKIMGETGTLEWNLLVNQINYLQPGKEPFLLYDGPYYDRNNMYLDELNHFAKVAEGELTPLVGFSQGLRVVHLIEAMKHSSETRQMITIKDFA